MVAARPPTRLCEHRGSGLGPIPLVGKVEGMGDEWQECGEEVSSRSIGFIFAGSSLYLQTTCGSCRADTGYWLLLGPPTHCGAWRSLTITNPREWKFGKRLVCP